MADADNNASLAGGLMGLKDPDLLMNVGLGLMSAAKYGGNVGDGLSQALGNYQRQKLMTQQQQMGQLELQRQRMMLGAAQQEFGQQPQQGPAPGGPMQMPGPSMQGAPAGAPPGAPQFMQPPTAGSLANTSIQGARPGFLRGMAYLSPDPLKGLTGLQQEQQKVAAMNAAPQLARIDAVTKSDDPVRDIKADPELLASWRHYAPVRGLDPDSGLNEDNARQVFSGLGNSYRLALGQAEQAPPKRYRNIYGQNGQLLQVEQGGETPGAAREIVGQKPPGFSVEKVTEPGTGKITGQLVQTAPGAAPAPNLNGSTAPRSGGSPRGGLGGTAAKVDLGYAPASAENNKAAMFASEMRAGLQTLTHMEGAGYRMSPRARAFAISMATDESAGPISQLGQQELAAHGLTAKDQVYIAGMMPLLQAAGHDQSGARLTTAQIRQNVESLLPLGNDPANLAQVQKNRDGFYQGLLSQGGSALQNPKYRGTLLADEKRAEAAGGTERVTKTIGNTTYYKQNGKWYAQ